ALWPFVWGRAAKKPRGPRIGRALAMRGEPPILLVKWYDLSKWLLERVESIPKSQRFVFGQRLADRSLAILETLVDAAWSPPVAAQGGAVGGCERRAGCAALAAADGRGAPAAAMPSRRLSGDIEN